MPCGQLPLLGITVLLRYNSYTLQHPWLVSTWSTLSLHLFQIT